MLVTNAWSRWAKSTSATSSSGPTNVTWGAAKSACEAQGKRLCASAEWQRACGGKYPYGSTYSETKCNTMNEDFEERPLVPSGSKAGCRSWVGCYDMSGNAAEWTQGGTVNGGSSDKNGDDARCSRATKRYKNAGNSFVGFRCCMDLD